jgi:hypothetical protein
MVVSADTNGIKDDGGGNIGWKTVRIVIRDGDNEGSGFYIEDSELRPHAGAIA